MILWQQLVLTNHFIDFYFFEEDLHPLELRCPALRQLTLNSFINYHKHELFQYDDCLKSVTSPHYFWPARYHLQSAWFIRSKDKLVCGASVQWGILLFKSRLPPPSFSPSLSPTVCILPFTLHLAAACCFCWRGKEQDSPGKKSLPDKIPSLKVPGEVEEWKVPRPSLSAERLSKNKANHMAANPGVNEKESS